MKSIGLEFEIDNMQAMQNNKTGYKHRPSETWGNPEGEKDIDIELYV